MSRTTKAPAPPQPYDVVRLPIPHPKRDDGYRWGFTNRDGIVFGYARTQREARVWADALRAQIDLLQGVA